MQEHISDILKKAAANGEVLRIIYHGGSQPGSLREIIPIAVTDKSIRARDMATGIVKTFVLAKIEPVPPGQKTPLYDPHLPPQPRVVQTIQEALSSRVSELQSVGWHVTLSQNEIGLHRYFKNGKPQKTPVVSLSFSPTVSESVYNPETDQIDEFSHTASRPYRLVGPEFIAARTFSNLDNVVQLFLDIARKFAPGNAP